jgi:hypothetical protein
MVVVAAYTFGHRVCGIPRLDADRRWPAVTPSVTLAVGSFRARSSGAHGVASPSEAQVDGYDDQGAFVGPAFFVRRQASSLSLVGHRLWPGASVLTSNSVSRSYWIPPTVLADWIRHR